MRYEELQKLNQILLAPLLFFGVLYLGRPFIIPIAIGILIAMLLLPVAKRIEKFKISRGLTSLICIVILLLLFISLLYFMTGQITGLLNDLPAMKQNIEVKLESAQKFIDNKFETPKEEKGQLLDAQLTDIFSSVGGFFTSFLFSIGSFITNLFIVAFYAFFFLNYRKRCKIFITGFISRKYKSGSSNVFNRIAGVANNYISGVFLVVIILSIINTIGLTIIGIEHALFFGVLAGLLNIIPFAGSLVGSLIPVSFVLFTQQSWFYPITVAIFFLVVQTVESYLLTPNITGNKIKLNPLATITALLLGGLIWGIAGMILFVPYLGIAKVIFNHIEELRPFSYFIGIEKEEQ